MARLLIGCPAFDRDPRLFNASLHMSERSRPHSWKVLPEPSSHLAEPLVVWFDRNGRDYPWRNTTDPYFVLCAEFMLQRTWADQVAPVFEKFCRQFEGPVDVLNAGGEVAEEIFASLGLRWRADYFQSMNEALVERNGGRVPEDLDSLTDLPGVGLYTATATRVFAFGQRGTVVDANTLRVLGRWFGIDLCGEPARSRRMVEWAGRLAPSDPDQVRAFNWALLDLGALVCTPTSPACRSCPIREGCWYASDT